MDYRSCVCSTWFSPQSSSSRLMSVTALCFKCRRDAMFIVTIAHKIPSSVRSVMLTLRPDGAGNLWHLLTINIASLAGLLRNTLTPGHCLLLLQLFFPLGVDKLAARVIRALIGVRAEEVALRLRQVQRQIRRAVHVEVAEARRHRRHRDAHALSGGHCLPPARLRFERPGVEVRVEQQVRQVGAAL